MILVLSQPGGHDYIRVSHRQFSATSVKSTSLEESEWKAGPQVKECVQFRVDPVAFEICHFQGSPLKDPV